MSQREDRKRFIVSGALRADGLMPAPYVEEAKELGLLNAAMKHTPEWERVEHCVRGTVSGATRDRYQRWLAMGRPRHFVEPQPLAAQSVITLPLTTPPPLPTVETVRFEAAAVDGRTKSGVAFLRDGQPLEEAEIMWL
jgi:hypothetical protein